MVCRAIEAFVGILFSIDQRNYRMDYVGVSFSLRGIFDLVCFSIILYYTHNVVLATLSMTFVTLLIMLFFDLPMFMVSGRVIPVKAV